MILDSRVGVICAPGTEYLLLAKISMNYTCARLYEYRPHAIVDPMPGVCSTGCNWFSAMRMEQYIPTVPRVTKCSYCPVCKLPASYMPKYESFPSWPIIYASNPHQDPLSIAKSRHNLFLLTRTFHPKEALVAQNHRQGMTIRISQPGCSGKAPLRTLIDLFPFQR